MSAPLATMRPGSRRRALRWAGWYAAAVLWGAMAVAQTPGTPAPERDIGQWLQRMHEAARGRAFIGTFVVSAGGDQLSSARIWHVCDGRQQVERVEALTGPPRSTYRRDDQVLTFYPESRLVRSAKHEALGGFPMLIRPGQGRIPDYYRAERVGEQRVAGYDADLVEIRPLDGLRFGYRVWSEKRTGLPVKMQTLDASGRVLEQAAFSELQIDAPVKLDKLARAMVPAPGWRVEAVQTIKTTAEAEGWTLRAPVAGFQPVSCQRRPGGDRQADTLQWTFSDGLALVSLFVETYDPRLHGAEGSLVLGATHTLRQRLDLHGRPWWITAVGEVPMPTLKTFVDALERLR